MDPVTIALFAIFGGYVFFNFIETMTLLLKPASSSSS
ncbi:hypothetical protein X471_00757 [Bartonella bacilliformis str. Heidi Mejia]|nr:hypothetical protein X471_00757 [Bartonella bacilliformis str. Heidi Mejia]KEG19543.1 hypothetical protein H707_00195 [Bartonella bacilliformis Hosp800-02]KEG24889.1 hypothetical protein H706_00203 [Bartonella bacilliformis CAR600-02]